MPTAEHFTVVAERNAIRRAAGLPLLDVRAEMAHMEALDAWRAWNAICETYAEKRAEIRARIVADFTRKGRTMRSGGGQMAIGILTDRAFHRFLNRLGHTRPDLPDRNVIVYGGGAP